MNNTIYNETIRDMTHVSKLASQKFYNRTAPEISQIYFPQSDQKKIKNIVVETDADTSGKLLEYVTKRVYFYDKNNNNKLDDDEQLAYNAYIYTSTDAIKLKETYEVAEAGEDDVLIFVEDNQGDVSSQFCRARVGKNVLSNLKNAGHLYNNRKLLARINEHAPIDEAVLNELLKKGKIENTTLKVLEFLFAVPDYLGPFSPNTFVMKGLGTICEEIAKFINKVKVDDYRWNPQAKKRNEDGTEDETHEFAPFLFPFVTEALDSIDDSKVNGYMQKSIAELKTLYASQDQAIQNYVKNVDVGRLGNVPIYFPYGGYVNVEVDLVPDSIELFLFNKYLQVKKVIDAVFEKLEGFDFTDLIKKGITTANAFLCGVWNGLVDAISGIFVLLEMVFKAAAAMNDFRQNFSTEFPILLEYIDNFTEALSSIDFKELYTHLKTKLSDASIGSISLETIAYFSGAFIGFVISLVIEIVVGILFTGGTLSVAAVIEKLAAIFSGLLRAGAKVLKKTFDFSKKLVINTFKGFKKLLQGIINLLRKGTAGFKKMIDDVFLAISKAKSIDPNKELIDSFIKSIDELSSLIKASNIENHYSKVNLKKLLEIAIKNNLTRDELLGFIKVGNIKKINLSDLKRQMKNYANVVLKRGYPYKFKSLKEFKRFSKDLLDKLKKVNIPIDDVRIQGSVLRKKFPKPKDVDLAVFVKDDIFNNYLRKAFKGKVKLDGKIIDIENMSSDALLKLADEVFDSKNTNAISRTFAYAIKNAKISASTKPRIILGHKDVVRNLNKKYPDLNIEDISIQKTGGKLELKPDLKIK